MKTKYDALLLLAIIFVALAAGLYGFNQPRELWDERSRYMSGLVYWHNILIGDFNATDWSLNSAHPMIAKYIYGLANGVYLAVTNPSLLASSYTSLYALDMAKTMAVGHAVALLLAVLICIIIYFMGSEIFNRGVGFAAAIILILLPPFMASVRYANLDMPMAFFFMMSMMFLFRALASDKPNSRYYLLFGVSAGLCVSSLLSGGLVFIIGLAVYFNDRRRNSLKVPKYIFVIPVLAAAIFFGSNPWLWSDPIGHLSQSLGLWNDYYNMGTGQQEYFFGNFGIPNMTYFAAYFVFTTPVLVLALAAISLFWVREKHSSKVYLSVLIWLLLSLLIISFIPTRVNGATYIVPLFPPLALLAALGLEKIYTKLGYKTFVLAFGVLLVYLVSISLSIHPFYVDYYNEVIGGTKAVYDGKLMRIGAAGEGLDLAVDYININAPLNSSVEFHAAPIHVLRGFREDIRQENSFFSPNIVSRASNLTYDWSFHDADYIIENVYYKWYIDGNFNPVELGYKLDYTVNTGSTPLVWIYKKD